MKINHAELETAILGNLLNYHDNIFLVADKLKVHHFLTDRYGKIYAACLQLLQEGKATDILSIRRIVGKEVEAYELAEIEQKGFGIRNLTEHADNLIRLWQHNETTRICREILEGFVDDGLSYMQSECIRLQEEVSTGSEHIGIISERVIQTVNEKIESIQRGERPKDIVDTGINALDQINGGFHVGELVIMAARPGMGKSMLMRQFALNMSAKFPVKIFTGEMGKEELVQLMGSNLSQIDSKIIRNGKMQNYEHKKFTECMKELARMNIEFDRLSTLIELIVSIKKWRMRTDMNQPAVVMIDYLQLMSTGDAMIDRDLYRSITKISMALKQIAIEMRLVMIVISQLNRSVESRGGDKIPVLSDLKESGQIEQDADVVLFLYRPEYYGFLTDDAGNSMMGQMQGHFAKYRNGITGVAKMQAILKYGKVISWDYSPGIDLDAQIKERREMVNGSENEDFSNVPF